MKCLFCGTENASDSLFCENCGKPLQREEQPVYIRCPHCARKNPPDSRFCEACGQSLEAGRGRVQGAAGRVNAEERRQTPGRGAAPRKNYKDPRERTVEGFGDPRQGAGQRAAGNRAGGRGKSNRGARIALITGISALVLILAGVGIFLGVRFLAKKNSDMKNGTEILGERDSDAMSSLTQTEQKEDGSQTSQTQAPQSETLQPQPLQVETQPQTQQPQTSTPLTEAPVVILTGDSSFFNDGRVVEYGSYILPDSSTRYLSDEELNSMTLKGLCYAKNELYAKYGRKFSSSELASYFGMQSWYQGIYEPTPENDSMIVSWMNDFEIHNMEALSRKEESLGTYKLQ